MLIAYATARLQERCEDRKKARKAYPQDVADVIERRLSQLVAFNNLGEIPFSVTPLRFHPLRENYSGYYAIWITPKYRAVLRPAGEYQLLFDGAPDLSSVTEIEVVTIEDYHSGAN